MKKPYALVWGFVLLLSLSLVGLMIQASHQQHDEAPTITPTPLPSETPLALALAPTRFLPTVAPPPTETPLPSPLPTMTAFAVTLAAPAPRVFDLTDNTSNQSMLASYCAQFGTPVGLSVYDWTSGTTVSLSDDAIAQIPLQWDASNDIWQGYEFAHAFNQPADATLRWKINLFLPDLSERWINIYTSPEVPDLAYVYTFQKITPFADAQGQHFGLHPCRAFTITSVQMQSFLNIVAQYQDAIHYPTFITSDDPRWQRGIATPVGAYADLRSIPSDTYNDPIGSIAQQVSLWYALDPTWGSWAQVKIGSVQAWVDTGVVKIALAP